MRPLLLAVLAACSFDPEPNQEPSVDPGDPVGGDTPADEQEPGQPAAPDPGMEMTDPDPPPPPPPPTCAADTMEPNQDRDASHDLGEYYDELGGDDTLAELVVGDAHDEDWFTFHVVDAIGFVNPVVSVDLEQQDKVHELEIFYSCDGGIDDSTCFGLPEDASGFGTACRGLGDDPGAIVMVQCGDTLDESGTVWVRVRRPSWDETCQTYSLRVRINR